jgi:aspartyl-tRNA(Asn)/glutamyl-tRNA(Gln) amidotransferase subunit C
MMKISNKDVEHLALLARMSVDESELESLSAQVNGILNYIDILKDADVEGVSLASGAAIGVNVFRPDEVRPSPGPSVTLAAAPERIDDFYMVPRIVGRN